MGAYGGQRIGRIVVWVGGTLLPELEETTCAALLAFGIDLSTVQRVAVHQLAGQLLWGNVETETFFRSVAIVSGARLASDVLTAQLLASAAPRPQMLTLLRALAAALPVRFVSDYPRAWLAALAGQHQLGDLLNTDQTHYTAGLNADNASWCDRLLADGVLLPDRMLWIDRSTPRALAVLRRGVDVALCEDAGRLRRDLALWGLLPPS